MLQLTFALHYGRITFKTSNADLHILGQFFVTDVAFMPDFMRAVLVCPSDECIILEATTVTTTQTSIAMQSNTNNHQSIVMDKNYCVTLLNAWEDFLYNKKPSLILHIDQQYIVIHSVPTNSNSALEHIDN